MPQVEVKPRRVGGATYQVPHGDPQDRKLSLALRWLVAAARKRSGKTMIDRLSASFRMRQQYGSCRPPARRQAQDGRREQGLRPLPLLANRRWVLGRKVRSLAHGHFSSACWVW